MPQPNSSRIIVDRVKNAERLQGKERRTAWLEAWELLKSRLKPRMRTLTAVENAYLPLLEIELPQWLERLADELVAAAENDPTVLQSVAGFCEEFCRLFKRERVTPKLRRILAEASLGLGQPGRSEEEFLALVEKFPRAGWLYVAWGDIYSQPRFAPAKYRPNFKRAEEIYLKGIEKSTSERDELRARLRELDNTKAAYQRSRSKRVAAHTGLPGKTD